MIEQVNQFIWGWAGYFRLATVKLVFEQLDQWLRRRLRKILWEQWRTPKTRCRKLIALGVKTERARKATATGRAAWWNAGASHMHAAITNRLLAQWGLLSMGTSQCRRVDSRLAVIYLNRRVRNRTHGGVGGREGRLSLLPDHLGK
ncbi:group II intron maturase-specific domain-containing protein [Synechococcus sp. PCC 7336]|uniref:group II intron maturase-specific domain-containing protein n=1 Tax=Synechococcus sp. PCC 7336 TaxID=195250 RepID=UPI0003602D4A